MNITIGIVAYNEEKYLPSILEDITKQNYPHENIEIVLADSMSEDQTRVFDTCFLSTFSLSPLL